MYGHLTYPNPLEANPFLEGQLDMYFRPHTTCDLRGRAVTKSALAQL